MDFRRFIAPLFLLAGLTHCGPDMTVQEEPQSMLHFIPFSTTQGISLRYARESTFNVCAQGATNSQVEQWSIRAVLTWLKAVRIIDDQVTREVAITCQNPHLRINMRPGTSVSFASPGNANFFTGKPYGELLHELGHALAGLSDTYVGRQAGACRQGHPESNMCWGAYGPRRDPEQYSGLWPDDIAGVQAQHRKLFANAKAPANAPAINAETPVDAKNPWPVEGDNGRLDQGSQGKQIYAALAESATDSAKLYLSMPLGTQTVALCENIADQATCLASPAKILMQSLGQSQGRLLYVSAAPVLLDATKTMYAFAVEATGQSLAAQGFKFQQR